MTDIPRFQPGDRVRLQQSSAGTHPLSSLCAGPGRRRSRTSWRACLSRSERPGSARWPSLVHGAVEARELWGQEPMFIRRCMWIFGRIIGGGMMDVPGGPPGFGVLWTGLQGAVGGACFCHGRTLVGGGLLHLERMGGTLPRRSPSLSSGRSRSGADVLSSLARMPWNVSVIKRALWRLGRCAMQGGMAACLHAYAAWQTGRIASLNNVITVPRAPPGSFRSRRRRGIRPFPGPCGIRVRSS